jgi:hypothetical protein
MITLVQQAYKARKTCGSFEYSMDPKPEPHESIGSGPGFVRIEKRGSGVFVHLTLKGNDYAVAGKPTRQEKQVGASSTAWTRARNHTDPLDPGAFEPKNADLLRS